MISSESHSPSPISTITLQKRKKSVAVPKERASKGRPVLGACVTAHLRETNVPLRRQILKAIGLIMNKDYV